MTANFPIYLLVMAGVTYLIRMLPLTIFRKEIKSTFIKSFLHYVPFAVLGAMTIPDVLYSTGDMRTAAVGLVVAVFLAWKGKSLLTVALAACAAVLAAQGSARPQADSAAAQARVLVQGIADIVLVFDDHIELLDYKTDRKKTEQEFLDAYRAQLNLYALAIEKRFAPKPVTYKGIYSFSLNRLLEVET